MSSLISWLDHSEDDQRRIREVLKLFTDKGTVDDLGLGTIRDAFSNLMFPGTSIIQTRARYFLFIPWAYRHFEKKSPENMAAKVDDFQRRLIDALKAGEDQEGIIGRVAGRSVKNLPSAIYWSGLARYGIFTAEGLTERNYAKRVANPVAKPEYEGEQAGRTGTFWNPDIPAPPDGFYKFAPTNFDLSRDEAEWLVERMISTDTQENDASLLSAILREFLEGGAIAPTSASVWELPRLPKRTSERMRELVKHAERFSCLAQGAALLYNLLLAKQRKPSHKTTEATSVGYYREALHEWTMWADTVGLQAWCDDLDAMWGLLGDIRGGVPKSTRDFVNEWAAIIRASGPDTIAESAAAERVIVVRERAHKRGQARFTNESRVGLWEGMAGTSAMVYRWPQVKIILKDIADGLNRPAGSGAR